VKTCGWSCLIKVSAYDRGSMQRLEVKMNRNGMRPIHPGEILSEEFLKPLGITITALARSMTEPEAELIDVLGQQSGVGGGLAGKLSVQLNTTPEFWLNLRSTFDLRPAQIERG